MSHYQNQNYDDNGFFPGEFFTIDIRRLKIAIFNLTQGMIVDFNNFIENIGTEGIVDEKNFISILPLEDATPVTTLIIRKNLPDYYGEDLVLNYSPVEGILYLFANKQGCSMLQEALMFMQQNIINKVTNDEGFMIQEWGGVGLKYEKIVPGSEIICHLRMYGAF